MNKYFLFLIRVQQKRSSSTSFNIFVTSKHLKIISPEKPLTENYFLKLSYISLALRPIYPGQLPARCVSVPDIDLK